MKHRLAGILLAAITGFGSSIAAPAAGPFDPGLFVIDTGMAGINVVQGHAAVAFDGECYLVAWQDNRSSGGDIYGAFLDTTGRLLDPIGIAIATGSARQLNPAAAAGDSSFLVVWYDRTLDPNGDILGCRVTAEGRILDPDRIRVAALAGTQEFPAVAHGDSSWLVVWTDNAGGKDIRAARVSWSGRVLDPGGFVVAADSGSQTAPAVTYNGDEFLVVWQTDRSGMWMVRGTRVDDSGRLLDPGGLPIGGDVSRGIDATEPALASDGNAFFVAWQTTRRPCTVYGTRVSAEGRVLDRAIHLAPTGAGEEKCPDVAFDGRNYLAAWHDHRNGDWDIYGSRVSPEGRLLDSVGISISTANEAQEFPAMAAGGSRIFVAWNDEFLYRSEPVVRGALVDSTGAPTRPELRVSTLAPFYCDQLRPSAAGLDDGYVVLWESDDPVWSSGFNTNVCGARLDCEGYLVDTLTVATGIRDDICPVIATGDSVLLVAYAKYGGFGYRRLTRTGEVLDPDGLMISAGGTEPDVAPGDTMFLVVWHTGGTRSDIRGARVTQSGRVLDPIGFDIATGTDEIIYPSVCFDGTNFLVVWQAGYYTIKGTRVRPSGTVIDPIPFVISGTSRAYEPSLAFDGCNYLVAWTGPYSDYIYAARVTTSAEVLDPDGIRLSQRGYNRYPSVAFDGTHFVVCWEDDYQRPGCVNGTLLSSDGLVLDSFSVANPNGELTRPVLAAGPDNQLLLACSGPVAGIGGCDSIRRILAGFVSLPVGTRDRPASESKRAILSVCPNPFAHCALIELGPAADSRVRVSIHDASGRLVRQLPNSGSHTFAWDGCDRRGLEVPAGVYFVTVTSEAATLRRRVTKVDR